MDQATPNSDTPQIPPLNRKQITLVEAILERQAPRLIDFEGAMRLGKSWAAVIVCWLLALLHPGIRVLLARWKQEDADGQLLEVWLAVAALFPKRLHPQWIPSLHAYKFSNGSIVYRHGLRPSENEARNSKWRGKTLAVIVIDQAEELPEWAAKDLQGRLSQSSNPDTPLKRYAYPLHLIFVPNSIDEDHWLAEWFPTENGITGRWYLTGSLYDNAENLNPEVIAGLEAAYPEGDPDRTTKIEGQRGPTLTGKPVYGGRNGSFKKSDHVSADVKPNALYPIYVGWDFGEEKPAIVFAQWIRSIGAFRIVLSIKGKEMVLEDLAPKVLEIQKREFPGAEFYEWCDPTGAKGNGGMRNTPVRLLHDHGVPARYEPNANDADVRYAAIQAISGFMRREAADGSPAFQMSPRCIELEWNDQGEIVERETQLMVTAFSTGYVWAENVPSDAHPNIRKPKKGTRYDDLMNAVEYVVIGEKLGAPVSEKEMTRERARLATITQRQAEVAAQHASRVVGPTGETYVEAMARLAKFSLTSRDVDPYERRRINHRLSGACGPRWGNGYAPTGRRGRAGW